MAFETKDQGNEFYKQGDFKRALAKYTRVQGYTKCVLPSKDQEASMYMNLSKSNKVLLQSLLLTIIIIIGDDC
jgi:hypothetical protein